ncbi:MAG: hypothetical protein CSYNP_01159 [Syntrophus sp. SKADARSKE-3]|nr:hypothetical protein [Syntrophus sp. SKADARSKE-3]
MDRITLFTIGFAKKSAEVFFTRLIENNVKRVIDIRLHNTSQLAGFAKKEDLMYFLRAIGGIDYQHAPILAPTEEIFEAFKKNKGDWSVFEKDFLTLMASRKIEKHLTPELLHQACLLCSEETPRYCHRRLVGEYLQRKLRHVDIRHIE